MTKISVYQDVSVIEIAAGGIQGPKGDKGDGAATVTVGTTTTGNAGTNASVTNSGTANDVVLNFTIPQGLKGDKGDTGNPGTNGTNGTDGDSAYQVAVSNGFVGTEAQWLNSLVGPQGDAGTPGTTGAGVAAGGTAGQVLTKVNSTDYNTQWSTLDLSAKQDVVSGVSSTEIGYLDGVTSNIQTQLNNKLESTDLTDYATTAYVDATAQGLDIKASVIRAYDTNQDLSTNIGSLSGARILLFGQTNPVENGIYYYAAGQMNRTDDAIPGFVGTETLTRGAFVFVELGDFAGKGYVCTQVSGVGGILWSQFSESGQYITSVGTNLEVDAMKQLNLSANVVTISGSQTLTNKTIDNPSILIGTSPMQETISATEIGYLNGVTSSIQTQLNAKQATINPGTGLTFNTYSGIPYLEIDQTSNINVTGLSVSGSVDFTGATVTGISLATDPTADIFMMMGA